MTTTKEIGDQTLASIHQLHQQGIKKIGVIIRHSERHYDNDYPDREPFMPLTEHGKDLSFRFGEKLPPQIFIRTFSSFIGRCIETAYLIDKGYMINGGKTRSNMVELFLSPFYAKNPVEILKAFLKSGNSQFIRAWMNGDFSSEVIADPTDSAKKMVGFAKEQLLQSVDNHIDIHITHDWNLYLIKEIFLGLKHEEVGKIEFLEGVVLYKQGDELFISNHQADPRTLDL